MRTKQNRLFLILWMIMFLTGCAQEDVFTASGERADTDTGLHVEMDDTAERDSTTAQTSVYVYVCGKVNAPGVYALPADARIYDAIVMAGGVAADGNPEALNQAEHITDGQTLYVPGYEEDSTAVQPTQQDGRVNINTAGKEELMTLPGIGESKADTIVRYREEHGSFRSVEELMDIPGIKEGVFNKIKNSIKV